MIEKKIFFFAYMAASAYRIMSKEVETRSLDTIETLDTHAFINNPH